MIWEAEEHMFVFGLRPSESVSTDIGGLITLSRGLTGDVSLSYSNITGEILYNITAKNKMVCVKATAYYTSTDCSSSPDFEVEEGKERVDGSSFSVIIEKSKDGAKVKFKT